jgi:uncharacterized damage-inducible protein DinB
MDAMTIQEQLEDVRIRLLEAIAPLPDEALLQSGAVGEWSVADVLAHLVNWEAELVTALLRIDQGKKPTRLLAALADRDAYNEARYQEMKGRDLDRIFDDLQGVRVQLEEWLEEFSDQDLENPGRYPWLDRPLWKLIGEVTFEHEAAHIPALEAYSNQWIDEEADASIALTDIEVQENGDRG